MLRLPTGSRKGHCLPPDPNRLTRQELGRLGEDLAVRALEESGHEVLARNWRDGRNELDIVARREQTVAFVEVKTRRPGVQPAEEGLTPGQRRRLSAVAGAWIKANPRAGSDFAFDVVTVHIGPSGSAQIRHIPEAFYGDDC
ncbi:MAG: YraN family protein [Gemmatimonadetes bacterium]|nr:YraN family protein [Gemmatimonadota bacterium]